MGKDTVTYVTYSQGIDAKHLYLGNLAHDPRNPKFYEPYVDKSYTDFSDETPEWAQSTTLENFALTVGQDSDSPEKFQVVAGAKATRVEIKDPSTYFKTTTLASTAAKKWLTAHLSTSESLPSPSKQKPETYILTGLLLLPHATWSSISTTASQTALFTPGLPAPFDPTGVSNLRRLSVSDNVRPTFGFKEDAEGEKAKHISGAQILETGKFPGARVWAARWEKVGYSVKDGKEWKDEVGNLKLRLEGERKFAVLGVEKGSYVTGKGDEGLGDKFWEDFVDDLDDDEEE